MIAPVDGSGSCPAWIQTVANRASFGSFISRPTIVCYHAVFNLRMASDAPSRPTGSPPVVAPPPADLGLLRTTPARLLILSAALLLLLELIKLLAPLPEVLEI